MLARPKRDSQDAGEHIVVSGLFIQLLVFRSFIVMTPLFFYRIQQRPIHKSALLSFSWRKHLTLLLSASIFIMIRSIFRVTEYIQGKDGYILYRRIFLHVLDAALMLGVRASQMIASATSKKTLCVTMRVPADARKVDENYIQLESSVAAAPQS